VAALFRAAVGEVGDPDAEDMVGLMWARARELYIRKLESGTTKTDVD